MRKPWSYSRADNVADAAANDSASDTEQGPYKESKEPEWKAGKEEWAVMITIAVISLMVALDATILVPVLPELAADLKGSATDAFWAGTSYLLTSAVSQPIIASTSDIFGRRGMLLFSLFFFTLGTLLCAPIAKNFTVLLLGRSIQGIGGGGIITLGQVIFADIIPLRQRPKYFSVVLGAWAIGSVLGPLIGGLFSVHASWQWCFYINFPFCAAGFVLVPFFVKLSPEKSPFFSKLARVDWIGGFLFVGGVTTTLIGLSWAGIQFAWDSVQTLVPIFIGLAVLAAAIFYECRYAKEPFLTVSLFSSPSAMVAFAAAFMNGFILFCALFYLPLYFMAVRLVTPIRAGINLLPVSCFLLPGSIVVSVLTTRLGRFRWAIWIGWAITSLACGLLILFEEDTRTAVWAMISAVFGIGIGMVLTSLNVAIQAISPARDSGRAAAMYAFMRSIGMTVGVAVGGTTFQNVMFIRLDELGLPREIAKNAEGYIEELHKLESDDPLLINAHDAYVFGLHGVFWVMTGVAIIGFVTSFIIKKHSMDKGLESRFSLAGAAASPYQKRYQHRRDGSTDSTIKFIPLPDPDSDVVPPVYRRSLDTMAYQGAGMAQYDSDALHVPYGSGPQFDQASHQQSKASSAVIRQPPNAEAFYLFPNGARVPARVSVGPPVIESPRQPHEIPGLTDQQRASLLMHRDEWN
jgi:EmrB/QacA subfamily drug resistance transporter